MSLEPIGSRQYTHDASLPAVLLLLKDGMIQKAVLLGSQTTTVYFREEGRGGFGIVPVETATDFLAFDDLLTQEPGKLADNDAHAPIEVDPAPDSTGATVLAITIKSK